jgi:hypothetical protein
MSHQSEEVRQILRDIKSCSPEELLSIHGIEITSNGAVLDSTYNLRYDSVDEWLAVAYASDSDDFEKFTYEDDSPY